MGQTNYDMMMSIRLNYHIKHYRKYRNVLMEYPLLIIMPLLLHCIPFLAPAQDLEKVPAIFGSEVFPSKATEQIARETGVKFIDQLSDDELPAPPNNSFIGMMVDNMAIMTEALGGNLGCMENIDTSNAKP